MDKNVLDNPCLEINFIWELKADSCSEYTIYVGNLFTNGGDDYEFKGIS